MLCRGRGTQARTDKEWWQPFAKAKWHVGARSSEISIPLDSVIPEPGLSQRRTKSNATETSSDGVSGGETASWHSLQSPWMNRRTAQPRGGALKPRRPLRTGRIQRACAWQEDMKVHLPGDTVQRSRNFVGRSWGWGWGAFLFFFHFSPQIWFYSVTLVTQGSTRSVWLQPELSIQSLTASLCSWEVTLWFSSSRERILPSGAFAFTLE